MMNKLRKGIIAFTHPIKFYKLSNKLKNELRVLEDRIKSVESDLENERKNTSRLSSDLENERKNTLKLSSDLEVEKQNSIFYSFPYPAIGANFYKHDKSKKQILVIGYYGATNCGDELMLKSILKKATNSEEYSILLSSNNYRYNFNQWNNCFVYRFPKSINELDKITDFYDELIIGGGAHIDDKNDTNIEFIPFLAVELSILFNKKGKKIRWIAVSSNREIKSSEYINKLNLIVNNSFEFTVRDNFTYNLLVEKLGFDSSKIKLVDDLVLDLGRKKIIGITLMDFFNNEEKNIEFIKEIIQFVLISKNQYKVCFITFFNERHHDKFMYERLISKVDFKGVEYFISTEYDLVDDIYLTIAACDLFINMRYHASLLSLLYNKPTISICYDIHRHYYNKMTYINEKFNNPYVLSFLNYRSGQLLDILKKIGNV